MRASPSRFTLLFLLFHVATVPLKAVELPTSLACSSNAKAARDYSFDEAAWSGVTPVDPKMPFGIFSLDERSEMDNRSREGWGIYPLRDKVFSGLDTATPTVRSITRYADGIERAEEIPANTASRFGDTVFLVWGNISPANKIWSAAVDLKHRKVTLTQVFRGATSVGAEIETLDCR